MLSVVKILIINAKISRTTSDTPSRFAHMYEFSMAELLDHATAFEGRQYRNM